MYRERVRHFFVVAALLAFGSIVAFGQDAQATQGGQDTQAAQAAGDAAVKVRVSPPQAYIFVDGQPFAHRSQTIKLSPGQHTIGVYNWGYKGQVQKVDLQSGKNPEIVARLEPEGDRVTGPYGKIQIEDPPNQKAAVFINEQKPEFFVGHIDEMNNGHMFHQKLILPVGTYKLILVNPKETQPVYNESIEVKNNQRTVINVRSGKIKYITWKAVGEKKSEPRFSAGMAKTTISVAPVTAGLKTDKTMIKCGENATLSWNSTEAPDVTMAASPPVAVEPNGQKSVSPTQTTTYTLEAKGAGGIVKDSQTVHVDPHVKTGLTANPIELKYRRIDDKVITPANTSLAWQTDNAQQASIDPLGSVSMPGGEKSVTVDPKKTDVGEVDEMHTYTLAASNNCGGSDKSLAAVHVTGTIEPLPIVPLASVFFPTAWPTEQDPNLGLLNDQNDNLKAAVEGFKKFLEYDPDTKLKLTAHTDPRSDEAYNQPLSERRGNLVKAALVALGVDANKIEVQPEGESQELDTDAVKALEQEAGMNRPVNSELVHAYNRRVDITMVPTAKPQQESKKAFPEREKGDNEVRVLESLGFPGRATIEKLSAPIGTEAAPAAAPAPSGQQ